jgi:hypothetical protein
MAKSLGTSPVSLDGSIVLLSQAWARPFPQRCTTNGTPRNEHERGGGSYTFRGVPLLNPAMLHENHYEHFFTNTSHE